ncbi:hypothetical protein [Caloranaerobacter azorensis]|uniref:hypothetical protein n=1 Tax=Caloranaerobacter azorensis TaxID=116090 RepID=UPI0009331F10|nr:hypothetical protein [Caloranaerobacter azorensis]
MKIKTSLTDIPYAITDAELLSEIGWNIWDTERDIKIGSLRGLLDNSGIIEETVIGSMKIHDLELCRDLILKSKVLKEGDILINDRGFISREIVNKLKKESRCICTSKEKYGYIQTSSRNSKRRRKMAQASYKE